MTTLFLAWLAFSVFSGVMLLFMAYWDLKYPKFPADKKAITLWDMMVGAFIALCPFINILVSIGMVVWFCSEVAPKIVLFGPKK